MLHRDASDQPHDDDDHTSSSSSYYHRHHHHHNHYCIIFLWLQQPSIFWDSSSLETNWRLLKGQYNKQVVPPSYDHGDE
jgi:hypothetical protein